MRKLTKPTYIIAEVGVNHNGDIKTAFQLVDVAVNAGVDAVKFQTFKAENLVVKGADKAEYQKQTTDANETQFSMLKRLELSLDAHYKLHAYCDAKGVDFLSTAFDMESLKFLDNKLKLKTLKIPSGEITNGPLLLAFAQTGCNLILSTGMSTLDEVKEALGVLAFGFLNATNSRKNLSKFIFQQAYLSNAGKKILKDKVTILHCTTEYPTPYDDINLNAMTTMHNEFNLNIGYSDHSEGIFISVAAVVMGATMIEKHFTLNKLSEGPDHKASLEPSELTDMVFSIRSVEQAMGDGKKVPARSEIKNRDIARKSIVAIDHINKGESFSEKNISIKRPGTGICPMNYWAILAEKSDLDYAPDNIISWPQSI
jgi:N-acetylneuraminate synthase